MAVSFLGRVQKLKAVLSEDDGNVRIGISYSRS